MFSKNFFKEKKSLTITFISSFIILQSLVFFFIDHTVKHDTNYFLSAATPDFQTHIKIANVHLTEISKIFYDLEINRPKIKKIMYKASTTQNTIKQAKLRVKLLNLLKNSYAYMKKYNVCQLHFQLPDAVSFFTISQT